MELVDEGCQIARPLTPCERLSERVNERVRSRSRSLRRAGVPDV